MLKPSNGVFKKLFSPDKMAETKKRMPPANASVIGKAVSSAKTAAKKPMTGGILSRFKRA